MLTYALSHPKVPINVRLSFPPAAPPSSPTVVSIDISMPSENDLDEHDHHDGLDFTLLRAELDRLLEEGHLDEGHHERVNQDSYPSKKRRNPGTSRSL
ncbi:hypothetical protein ON010_g14307 [Phytophthora cinnamomi]|nr:hypothetical protein ON010_g14307 [Phytophthora cinnamomi]